MDCRNGRGASSVPSLGEMSFFEEAAELLAQSAKESFFCFASSV